MIDKKEVGRRLKILRGERSQAEVAKAVGLSPGALANYESGLRMPKDIYKVRLAEYYKKPIQKIFYA